MGTTAGVVGMSAVSATAGAIPPPPPVNLIQNGSFENPVVTPGSYLTVDAGATTIPDWTVVTPASYISAGNSPNAGSVDVVSSTYNDWGCEDGSNCIDLAGTTEAPGGLVQAVTTTPGVEYSLSFWSAVNGDESTGDGVTHTLGVTVNDSTIDTVQAVAAGTPLHWVQTTGTFMATSNTSTIEFDDDTYPFDQNQGPTLDNVSLTAVSDTITASPVTPPIPPQVAGQTFSNQTVATFTDSDTAYLASQFTATINWGDGTTPLPAGVITGSDGSYTVTGTHTYAAIGTYGPVVVTITDPVGATGTATDNSVQVANAVTSCSGTVACGATVPENSQNNIKASVSTTGSGYVLLSTFPNSGSAAFSCGDGFKHAPSDVEETNTFTSETGTITATDTFPAKDGTTGTGLEGLLFWVCFKSSVPFKDLTGQSVTTGLLPVCNPVKPGPGPCIDSILPTSGGSITEEITYPAGDPGYR